MTSNLEILPASIVTELQLPYVGRIVAGFPSPANDYLDATIDLNKELIPHPNSTFIAKVSGLSMKDAGIDDQDILIIDKSLEPGNGKIAVCYLDGDFTLKRIVVDGMQVFLMPANSQFKPIPITEQNDFLIWGILTHVIKKMHS